MFSVKGTFGPLARDPDSIVSAMKALWDGSMHDQDPSVPPMLFHNDTFKSTQPLRIGYFSDMEMLPSCFTSHRAVDMAKGFLQSSGHEVKFSSFISVFQFTH